MIGSYPPQILCSLFYPALRTSPDKIVPSPEKRTTKMCSFVLIIDGY